MTTSCKVTKKLFLFFFIALFAKVSYSQTDSLKEVEENKKVINYCNEELRFNPNNTLLLKARGDAYFFLGEYANALRDYDKIILLLPKDAEAYYSRAVILYHLEKYNKSVLDLIKATSIDKTKAEYFHVLGLTYYKLNKIENSIAEYTKAIHIDSINPEIRNDRGLSYLSIHNYNLALNDFNEAILLSDVKKAKFYYNKAHALVLLEEYELAIDALETSRRQDFANPYLYEVYALLEYKMNHIDKACTYIKQAYQYGLKENIESLTKKYCN